MGATSGRRGALALLGDWGPATGALLGLLTARGHLVCLLPPEGGPLPPSADLLLARLTRRDGASQAGELARALATPWLAWCTDHDLVPAALEHGALSAQVVAAAATPAVVERAVANALRALAPGAAPEGASLRRHRRGDLVVTAHGETVEVHDGIVSLRGLHPDGQEVLLGLFGPGHVLVPSAEAVCPRRILAHTDVTVRVRTWRELLGDPPALARVQDRARLLELWAAAQGRLGVEPRLLAVLRVLAEQFGVAREDGLVVDVRVTHADLAAAVGADRTTVTRAVTALTRRRRLDSAGLGEARRYRLPHGAAAFTAPRPPRAPAARAPR
jgi:hypothetical protein